MRLRLALSALAVFIFTSCGTADAANTPVVTELSTTTVASFDPPQEVDVEAVLDKRAEVDAVAEYVAAEEARKAAEYVAAIEAEELRRQANLEQTRAATQQQETTVPTPVTAAPPTSPPPPAPTTGANWDALAQCESGGDWSYNGSSGYDGGLQFAPSTWISAGGGQYAPEAWMATREQQIAVAERVLASSGRGAWPGCSAAGAW